MVIFGDVSFDVSGMVVIFNDVTLSIVELHDNVSLDVSSVVAAVVALT